MCIVVAVVVDQTQIERITKQQQQHWFIAIVAALSSLWLFLCILLGLRFRREGFINLYAVVLFTRNE